MENLLLWQIIALGVGILGTYSGIRTLRQSDKEFIADAEEAARENADFDRISLEEAKRRYVGYYKKDPGSWRLILGVRALATGLVSLFAFFLLLIIQFAS